MRRRSCHRDSSRRDSSPERLRRDSSRSPAPARRAAIRTVADELPPSPPTAATSSSTCVGDAVQVADRNRRLRQQAEVEHARKLQEREEAEASRARAADHRRTLANVELEAPSRPAGHVRPLVGGEGGGADSGLPRARRSSRASRRAQETVIEFENDTGRGMVLDPGRS